jgi:tetratricopeptide (TPR) repeat protein
MYSTASHPQVRQLLRKLHSPGALDDDPLAAQLCDAMRTNDRHEALLAIVDAALRPYDPVFGKIIKAVDTEGKVVKGVADDLHLSYRTLHRHRSTAIAAISKAIERALGHTQREPARPVSTALRLVGAGRNQLARGTASSLLRAEHSFEEAIANDERFVDAWSGLATARCRLASALLREPELAYAKTEEALARGYALDRARPEWHAIRTDVLLYRDKKLDAARAASAEAMLRTPDDPASRTAAGTVALAAGEVADALDHLHLAVAALPDSLQARADVGIVELAAGRFDAARAWLESVVAIEPEHFFARHFLAFALARANDYDAFCELVSTISATEWSVVVGALEAYLLARTGERARALKFLDALNFMPADGRRTRYARAVVYLGLGAADEAVSELEAAVRNDDFFTFPLRWDPLLSQLRSEPRFIDLIERTGPRRVIG